MILVRYTNTSLALFLLLFLLFAFVFILVAANFTPVCMPILIIQFLSFHPFLLRVLDITVSREGTRVGNLLYIVVAVVVVVDFLLCFLLASFAATKEMVIVKEGFASC